MIYLVIVSNQMVMFIFFNQDLTSVKASHIHTREKRAGTSHVIVSTECIKSVLISAKNIIDL